MSRAFIQKRTPFKPTDIGGCSLWLDGADSSQIIFSSGSNVNTWNDKSGFSNSCSNQSLGTTITYPGTQINGLKTVNFTAGCIRGALNSTSVVNTTDVTIVIVTVETAANNNLRIFSLTTAANYQDDQANQMLIYAAPGANQVTFYRAGVQPTAYTVTQNVPFIYTVTQTSGTGSQWFNGGSNITAAITTTPFAVTNYNIGTLYLANQNYTGLMCEVIMYKTLLSTPQRQQVESYLAQKWGLRQQLPQGHPGTRGIVYPSDPVNLLVRLPYSYVFLPSSIGGCQLWLDAADPATLTLSGTTVIQWRDKVINLQLSVGSGTNTLTQNAFGNMQAILFNGGYLVSPSNVFTATENVNNITQFIIMKQTVNTPYGLVAGIGFYTQNTKNSLYINQNQSQIVVRRGYTTNNTRYDGPLYANTINQGYIYSALTDYQASTYQLIINGSTNAATAFAGTGTTTSDTSLIYVGSTSFNEPFYGYVAEYIIYNSVITILQREQVEGYLAWKWGLQANLPANHPYKTAAPSTTNALGISRPANVPIPPITISARPRPVFLYTATFTYSAAGNQTFQVPSTIRPATVTVYMWGAGAGGNTNYGGAGAMVQGVLTVIPGETLTIVVGQGGTIDGTTTYGGGGAGGGNFTGTPPNPFTVGIGRSNNGFPQNGGSGGGRSAIQRGGTDPTNDIVVAGGGGGGTYFSSDRGGAATFSGTANPGTGGLPGLGGTQTAGGAGGGVGVYGEGLAGSRGVGGNTYNFNYYNGGGGGGGGYYGGGGGGTNGGDGAGGGGGSSLTGGLSLIPGQSVLGFNSANGFTAPNTASPYYQSGVGNGAPAINSSPRAGGNGLIVLIYYA